jgi:hypothetical protein
MTIAQAFKVKAKQLMPQQDDLQAIEDSVDSYDEIDDIMFHKGEYIGGMAAVIIELIKKGKRA